MKMTGMSDRSAATRFCRSRPFIPAEHQRSGHPVIHPHVQLAERQNSLSAGPDMEVMAIFSRARLAGMERFVVPAAASIVVGLLLGAAAIFGVTLMVQQDTKPPVQSGDPASSVLNRVEYGDRA